MSIIKRKKRDQFFIMSNHATQQDLTSLNAIGLLAYIKSLPEDWTLYKTYLQNKFTRRTVDSAWLELVEKKYIAGFSCYVDRKKRYYYLANDEPLTQNDFTEFVEETTAEILEEGYAPKNMQPIKDCNFTIAQNVQHTENNAIFTAVQNVQHLEYSTTSTVPDEQIQINNHKNIVQINNKKEIVNNNVNNTYINIIKEQFLESGKGLFNKEEINYFADTILSELTAVPVDPQSYFNTVVNTIISRREKKLGIAAPIEVPFYNWLEA